MAKCPCNGDVNPSNMCTACTLMKCLTLSEKDINKCLGRRTSENSDANYLNLSGGYSGKVGVSNSSNVNFIQRSTTRISHDPMGLYK